MAEMLMSGLKDILIHLSKNYGRTPLNKENAKRHEMGLKRGLQKALRKHTIQKEHRQASPHHGKTTAVKRKVKLMTCHIRSSLFSASYDIPFCNLGACPMFPVVLLSQSL